MAVDSVGDDELRVKLEGLLVNADLTQISIGALRQQLEQALGLSVGALDHRKQHVNALITELVTSSSENKRRAPGGGSEDAQAASKEKKRSKHDKQDKEDR